MEYKLKQAEAADMCQSIISVIVGKYIDRIVEAKNDKVQVTSRSKRKVTKSQEESQTL